MGKDGREVGNKEIYVTSFLLFSDGNKLRICTEDGETEVWVDKYFREHWGRLTARLMRAK